METVELVGPAVGLAGVVVGWFLASRTARRISEAEREERRRNELLGAVVIYWHELERLEDELRLLPASPEYKHRAPRRQRLLLRSVGRAVAKNDAVQAVSWLWSIILRRVLAREALDALESFKRTSRPLLFIGTPAIQESVSDAVMLVGQSSRDPAWWRSWEEMKLSLLRIAREELGEHL